MKNKLILTAVGAAIIAGSAGFCSGYMTAKKSKPSGQFATNFQNLSPEERQARMQQNGGGGGFRGGRAGGPGGMADGFVSGEIISKDDKSVTVKLRDGGSVIVFVSDSTKISKQTDGSTEDLTASTNVIVSGDKNSDGSYTAKSIQLVPALAPASAPTQK